LKKKKFLKNKPFDENDALQMQDWTEEGILENAKTLFTDGVVTGMEVQPNTNFNVNILAGKAYDSNYKLISLNESVGVTLDSPNSLNRYDTISLKYKTETTNNIDTSNKYGRGASWTYSQNILDKYDVIVRKGTPATTPAVPIVSADEIHLANVLVRNGATSVTSGDIEDKRKIVQLVIKPDAEEFGLETPEGAQDKADKAELDAINWAKSFGLGTYLSNNTFSGDLNTLVSETEIVYCAAVTNGPGGGNGYLLNLVYTANYVKQMYFIAVNSRSYTRELSDGVWSTWTEQETTAGAQTKANTAETNAKGYTDEKIKNSIQRFAKQYTVNTNTPAEILDFDETALDNRYTYFMHARVLNTGADVNATAIFTPNEGDGESTGFYMNIIYKTSELSNSPEFFINVEGKPSIRLYNHTSMYTVELTIERHRGSRHLYNTIMDNSEAVATNFTKSFGIGEQKVSTEVNLDNYITGGKYITPNGGLLNLPTGWAQGRYTIDVSGGSSYATQILSNPMDVANPKAAFRTKASTGNWSAWKEIETTSGSQAKATAAETNAKNASVPRTDGEATRLSANNGFKIKDGYFELFPYNSTYEDGAGTSIKSFYDAVLKQWKIYRSDGQDMTMIVNGKAVESEQGAKAKVDAATKAYGLGTGKTFTGDLNTLLSPGFYYASTGATNRPTGASNGYVIVNQAEGNTDYAMQQYVVNSTAEEIYQRVLVGGMWSQWALYSSEDSGYKTVKSGKDSNGIFTVIKKYRKFNGNLAIESTLSNLSGGNYTTRTIKYYAPNGTTVTKTEIYTLTYDADGDLLKEE
jgi:hypothetical protein